MSISVQWDNPEQTIVRWDFDREWTWEMFQEAQYTSNQLIQSVRHRVDIIGDVRRSPSLPHNPLFKYNVFQRNTPENAGLIVLIGVSGFVKSMVLLFDRVYRFRGLGITFADTLDEARAMLGAQSQSR